MNLIKKIIIYSDVLLLSLVICVNDIRYFMGIYHTNTILYTMYIFCLFVLYLNHRRSISYTLSLDYSTKKVFVFYGAIFLYALFLCGFSEFSSDIRTLAKFSLTIAIVLVSTSLPSSKIRSVFISVILINAFYALSLIINPERMIRYLSSDKVNYLNVTLTLGLSLTITLSYSIHCFLNHKTKNYIIGGILSILFYYVLIGFNARGAILFPFTSTIVIFFVDNGHHNKRSIILLPILAFALYSAYLLYSQTAEEYYINRMLKLVNETNEEDRFQIWKECIFLAIKNDWIIFGGGINAFINNLNFYPHNIFIQLWGEFGILAFVYFVYIVFSVLNTLKNNIKSNDIVSLLTMCSFIYYLLTFSKSFTLYEALPLLLMISFSLSLGRSKSYHIYGYKS